MKLKHIQSALSSIPIKQFPNPKITLEQYATSAELASYVIHYALSNGDIGPQTSILDLGCGTGMLAMGCGIVGTKRIICVDCDEDAIGIARDNIREMELEDWDEDDVDNGNGDVDNGGDGEGFINDEDSGCVIEFILAQVKHIPRVVDNNSGGGRGRGGRGRGKGKSSKGRGRSGGGGRGRGGQSNNHTTVQSIPSSPNDDNNDDGIPISSNCVDTVLTNPPFGTKHNAGIDVTFLKTAIRLATKAVYSFHKSSTSRYLIKVVQSWGYEVEIVAQMKFEIPKMYKFHKQDEVEVEVDLIRVSL